MTTPKTPYDDIDAWDTQEEARLFNRIEGYRRCHTDEVTPLQDALRALVEAAEKVMRFLAEDDNATHAWWCEQDTECTCFVSSLPDAVRAVQALKETNDD